MGKFLARNVRNRAPGLIFSASCDLVPSAYRRRRLSHKTVDAPGRACSLVGVPYETPQIEIVQATPADVGLIASLFDAYRQFYTRPSNEEAARRFLFARLSKGESVLFFAQNDRVPQGFVHLYPVFSSANLTRRWILNDLYVIPQARKHGVAHALMNRAQQFAEATQADGLTLETAADNHVAQHLYERLGWKRDEEFYRYFLAL
jgi:ribosomal protein S18 acetylase RimI-like enzyme